MRFLIGLLALVLTSAAADKRAITHQDVWTMKRVSAPAGNKGLISIPLHIPGFPGQSLPFTATLVRRAAHAFIASCRPYHWRERWNR